MEKKPDHYGSISISHEQPPAAPQKKPRSKKKSPPAKKSKQAQHNRSYLYIPLATALLLAGYFASCYFLIPFYIKNNVAESFYEHTAMNLSTGKIQFNPLSRKLYIDQVVISDDSATPAQPPILQIKTLTTDLNLLSLLRSRLVLNNLSLDELTLGVVRHKDKQYNIPFFSQTTADSVHSEIIEFAELPFLFSFNNIHISNSVITFDDYVSDKKHLVEKIELDLPTLSNFQFETDNYVRPHFSAIVNGSPVEFTGEAALPTADSDQKGLETKLTFDLNSLDLPLYFNYLPVSLPLQLTEGKADGKLELSFVPREGKGNHLNISFHVSATDVKLLSTDKSFSVALPRAELAGNMLPVSSTFQFDNILLDKPAIQVRGKVSSTVSNKLLPILGITSADKKSGTQSATVAISFLKADNGTLSSQPKKKSTRNRKEWEKLQLTVENFTNSRAPQKNRQKNTNAFHLRGREKGNSTSFSWQGRVVPQKGPSGRLQVSSIKMPSLYRTLSEELFKGAQGSAEVDCTFSLVRDGKNGGLGYSLNNGRATLTDLQLRDNGVKWLTAPVIRLKSFSYSDDHFNLGTLLSKEALTTFNMDKVPSFLSTFNNKKSRYTLEGINYDGSIKLINQKSKAPLLLTNVQFESSKLSLRQQPKDANMRFTATIEKEGQITAMGKLTLHPFATHAEVTFKEINSGYILPLFEDKSYLLKGLNNLAGKGTFTYPNLTFTGGLQMTEGLLEHASKGSSYSWTAASFEEFEVQQSPFSLNIGKFNIADLNIAEDDRSWLKSSTAQGEGLRNAQDKVSLHSLALLDSAIRIKRDTPPHIIDNWFRGIEQEVMLHSLRVQGNMTILPGNKNEKLLHLSDLIIEASELGNRDNTQENFLFSSKINDFGTVKAEGAISLVPLKGKVALGFSGIPANYVLPYFTQLPPKTKSRATLHGKGTLLYPEKSFAGQLKVADLTYYSTKDIPLFQWPSATIDNFTISRTPAKMHMDSVHIQAPTIYVKRERAATSLLSSSQNMLQQLLGDTTAREKTTNPPMVTSISNVNISNGTLVYTDESLTPAWTTDVTQLQGTLHNIRIPEDETAPATISLNGRVTGGEFSYTSHTHLFVTPQRGDITLKLTGVPMRSFAPQLKPLLEIEPSKAKFNLELTKIWEKNAEKGDAHFLFSSVTAKKPGSKTGLTLGLLIDSNDNIPLHIPLQREPGQKPISLFKQTVNTFQRLLVKTDVAPLLLAGKDFADLAGVRHAPFHPGVSTLTSEGRQTLLRYTKLLQSRPRLRLKVTGMADLSVDKKRIRTIMQQREQKRVEEENKRRERAWEERREALLAAGSDGDLVEQDIPTEELSSFSPITPQPIVVFKDTLIDLGKARSLAVYSLLTKEMGINPNRIYLNDKVQLGENSSHVRLDVMAIE